jgi:hypothetical protein
MLKPFFYNLASKEKNFDSVRDKVQELLDLLLKEALDRANGIISKYEDELKQTDEAIYKAQNMLAEVKHKLRTVPITKGGERKHQLARERYETACKFLGPTQKEIDTAKRMLSEMKRAVESRSYANIVALEAGELPKLVYNSREASKKAVVLANYGMKKLAGGCLLSLIVIAVSLAVLGTYLFTILT